MYEVKIQIFQSKIFQGFSTSCLHMVWVMVSIPKFGGPSLRNERNADFDFEIEKGAAAPFFESDIMPYRFVQNHVKSSKIQKNLVESF